MSESGPSVERPPLLERAVRTTARAVTVGSMAMSAATLVFMGLDGREEIVEFDGESTIVHAGADAELPIMSNVGSYAGGDAKHDVTLMPDSQAPNRGLFLQNVEYAPDGLLKLESFVDDKIGFYVLMSEYDGSEDKEFQYENLRLSTKQPVSCRFDLDTDEQPTQIDFDDSCTETLNYYGEWRGVEHSSFSKGGVGGTRLDNTPPTQSRIMTDTMLDNTWCQYGLRFGWADRLISWDSEKDRYVLNFTDVPITATSVYDNVRDRIVALYRFKAAERTGLPLTDPVNGKPYFITHTQRDFLYDVAEERGPLDELSAEELTKAINFEKILGSNDDDEAFRDRFVPEGSSGQIPFGSSVGRKLLDLEKIYPDIVIRDFAEDNDWAEEGGNPDTFIGNYACLPLESDDLAEFKADMTMTARLASMNDLPPGAELVPDPSLEEQDEISEVYVNPGGDTPLANYIEHTLPTGVAHTKVALHKRTYNLPLTEYELALLDQLEASQNG